MHRSQLAPILGMVGIAMIGVGLWERAWDVVGLGAGVLGSRSFIELQKDKTTESKEEAK